ncbi:MAG TPA: indolepyruvate oxidoreductase subunit beta [Thermoleophilia bacterium]|nr:indolepyruvate oxidoreductase subunit beta [Thermoleophilia bacterium]
MVRHDIIIAGVGGQGILTISEVLGRAALAAGLRVKQSEVHGMAQRGGAVHSHFRMAKGEIHSDVIAHGRAGMILGMEPMEALRYLKWLSHGGWLIANTEPVENIEDYPDPEELYGEIRKRKRSLLFDATAVAREAGSPRALNMAMLGAASPFLPIEAELLERAIAEQFQSKGSKVVDANIRAFRSARELAMSRKQETTAEP